MKQLVLSEWLLTQLNQQKFPARLPNHRRVYEAIRRAITEHVLPSGARLPSTRELSADLNMSRNTILAAFDQLLDEGYVAAKTGSGTFVCYKQTDALFKLNDTSLKQTNALFKQPENLSHNIGVIKPLKSEVHIELSQRGLLASSSLSNHEVQPFTPGEDDYSRFPITLWRRLLNRQWRALNPALLDSSHAGGYLPLRQAIAALISLSVSASRAGSSGKAGLYTV